MTDPQKSRLFGLLEKHGQSHVLTHWDDLSDDGKKALAEEIDSIDFALLDRLIGEGCDGPSAPAVMEPAPFVELPTDDASRAEWDAAARAGESAIAADKTAAFVVAGGQGTRLGFDGPKGCYPIGPVTGRTLFEIHAKKVLAASRRFGVSIPLLIMTSRLNDTDTRTFFERNDFFGLSPEMVRIFRQAEMPTVDFDGKLILDAPGHVFKSPNGHGGSLKALWDSGSVQWLEDLGVEYISYFQVDNPLVDLIDPAFIGFHAAHGSEMSLKLLRRTLPQEKLGIWVDTGGGPRVIEYIDMPSEKMSARAPGGGLLYPGGSIAINCLGIAFLRRLNEEGFALPFHRAKKKVPYLADDGVVVTPSEPNGMKFETFVFDALAFATTAIGVETTREAEFSPLKNAEGADSPETARRDISRKNARRLIEAGVEVELDADGYPAFSIELSPLADLENYHGPNPLSGELLIGE
jgi:UDP-N-acetylglucosamine/UDP-N-acetylgalactosamine diphosphorylase